jgi:SAM-dependent methyltransferase
MRNNAHFYSFKEEHRKISLWYEASSAVAFQNLEQRKLNAVTTRVRDLQRGLTGTRDFVGTDYMDDRSSFIAYLLYYWPVSLYETCAILEELRLRGHLPAIHSVLDVGSGSAPASFAASAFGAEYALLVDKSIYALETARTIAARAAQLYPKSGMHLEIETECTRLEDLRLQSERRFDLIVASHSMNELWNNTPNQNKFRTDFILNLMSHLSDHGLIIIIEPSAHITSIPLLALRDSVIQHHIVCVGPCPHQNRCPMRDFENRPCFSVWDWKIPHCISELAAGAGLDRTSLKASWIALQKAPQLGDAIPIQISHPPSTVRGRVVSEPMRNKADRIRSIICSSEGDLISLSAPFKDEAAQRQGFFDLERGDVIEAENLDRRSDRHFGMISESRLRVVMKAPRV